MSTQLSKYSTNSEIIINSDLEKIWKILSEASHLELFHPFCKSNKKVVWNDKNKIDELTYLNGLVYERIFYNWEKNKGFKLMIGKKNGKKSKVEWDLKSKDEKTKLTIKVTPYISKKFHFLIYIALLKIYVIPSLKKYLNNVTKGLKFFIEKGTPVKQNQFGKHKWFS